MDLNELLDKVVSKETFLEFVKALKEDKIDEEEKHKISPPSPYCSGANGWENNSIPHFLDSVEAFGEDSHHITEEPSWRNFALLLYAGKFYE